VRAHRCPRLAKLSRPHALLNVHAIDVDADITRIIYHRACRASTGAVKERP
jgi:hypothetical protein